MKVLLVDDEIFTIRMLENLIPWKELGLEVAGHAKNGEEAYDMVLKDTPDIIISDIKMPGMNGLEFLNRVRSVKPGIKTILMSAYADFSYVKEGMKLGCCDYILKPVDELELEQVLRKAVSEIQGQKEQEKVVSKSVRQLENINLYHYMKTGHGFNKVKKMKEQYRTKMQCYTLFMIQLSSPTIDEYNTAANIEMGREGYLSNILEHILSSWAAEYTIFDYEEGRWVIILEIGEDVCQQKIAAHIISSLFEETGIHVNICFSTVGRSPEQLPELYEEVQNLSKYSFYMGEEEILGYGYNCNKEELDQIRDIGISREAETGIRDSGEERMVSSSENSKKTYCRTVEESLALIEAKYNENLSLEEICAEVAVSKSYFCYLFKRETGMSVWNYLTVVRLQHAKELLESTDLKSYEIAFKVGYDNPSYFSKLFKKYENMTPNEYREGR